MDDLDLGADRAADEAARMRVLLARRRHAQHVKKAAEWNAAHPGLVAKFNQLTHGACAGAGGGVDVGKVRAWQRSHEVIVDGAVGDATVAAAEREVTGERAPRLADLEQTPEQKRANGGLSPDVAALFRPAGPDGGSAGAVNFSDQEAGTVEGSRNIFAADGPDCAGDGPREKQSTSFAERVVGGTARGDTEPSSEAEGEEQHEFMGVAMPEAVQGTAETTGILKEKPPEFEVPEGVEKTHEFEGVERAEQAESSSQAKKLVAVKGVAFAFRVPHLVDLLRAHRYRDAVGYVIESVTWEERAEFLKAAIERLAGELSPRAVTWLKRAVLAGAVGDVVQLGWEWVKLGFESIRKAHERGDAEARLNVYASAWAWAVMDGVRHDSGATAQEEEALNLGFRDGMATRERYPDLPGMLRAEYDNDDKARRALLNALYKSVGIEATAL